MPTRMRTATIGAAIGLSLLVSGCGTAEGSPAAESATPTHTEPAVHGEQATVLRVVDGDTVDVDLQGERTRVRLLNVDTPETKHPNKMVECLGPEATAFLEDLLPEGTVVGLEYDHERTDKYGRTLAGVYLADDRLVNAEIAREGLGVPVFIAPNRRFLPPVQEAFDEAQDNERGLLDPDQACTIPAQVQAAQDTLASSPTHAGIAEATAFIEALEDPEISELPFISEIAGLAAFKTEIRGIRERLSEINDDGEADTGTGTSTDSSTGTGAEDGDSTATAPEGRSDTAETNSGQAPVPAQPAPEQAEAPEQPAPEPRPAPAQPAPQPATPPRVDPPAPAPATQPRVDPPAPAAPAPAPAPKPQPQPQPQPNVADQAPPGYYSEIPGYTGPRCYAPGGKFYKPC